MSHVVRAIPLGDPGGEAAALPRARREGRSHPTRAAAMAAFRFVPEEPEVAPAVVASLAEHGIVERAPGDWRFRFARAAIAAVAPAATLRVFRGGHHFLLVDPSAVGAALRRFLDGLGSA